MSKKSEDVREVYFEISHLAGSSLISHLSSLTQVSTQIPSIFRSKQHQHKPEKEIVDVWTMPSRVPASHGSRSFYVQSIEAFLRSLLFDICMNCRVKLRSLVFTLCKSIDQAARRQRTGGLFSFVLARVPALS